MAGVNETTINFGSTPTDYFSGVITDANISPSSYVEAYMQANDSVGGDNQAIQHDMACYFFKCRTVPGSGNFTLNIDVQSALTSGQYVVRYAFSP